MVSYQWQVKWEYFIACKLTGPLFLSPGLSLVNLMMPSMYRTIAGLLPRSPGQARHSESSFLPNFEICLAANSFAT